MSTADLDMQVRLEAFKFLASLVQVHPKGLPAALLREGFIFHSERVQLKGPQGIFKPKILPFVPLSITTAPPDPRREAPYDDTFDSQRAVLYYRYRGTDPRHHENEGLRRAMTERRPLIYFFGIVRAVYCAEWPVYVVADDPAQLRFQIAFDDPKYVSAQISTVQEGTNEYRREYITVTTMQRLHQRSFRWRVLDAYKNCCALCRLRHEQLLDAAHIIPDAEPEGVPQVFNGVALCKLHHAAFDRNFIGIRPDLVVQVRPDILDETDGPMLIHGLQEFHDKKIREPSRTDLKPRKTLLERRFNEFLESVRT